jgi:5-methylcytosine-specific restriction endonuclease McrA
MRYENLTGQRFFRLIAMTPTEERSHGNVVWECRCDCGSVVKVTANHLKKGDTKSCGCWNRDVKVARNIARTKHGQAKTYHASPTYKAWARMIARCENPKHSHYKYYGGRGIKVDSHWRASFFNFFGDMGERPAGLTLDRKNPLKGYGPDNCQWVTQFEQGKNRTTNVYLTLGGETLILSDWVRKLGCKMSALRMRLSKGWSVERALTEPFEYRTPRKSTGPKLVSDAPARAKFRAQYKHLYRGPGDDLTFEQWQEILEKYDHRCAYCGVPDARTMDHVVPVIKGGLHTSSNVVPACRKCNSSKGSKMLR